MITINLLPPEFKVTEKKAGKIPGMKFLILGAVLFVLLTSFFYFDFLGSALKLTGMEKEWKQLEPQSVAVRALKDKIDKTVKPETDFLRTRVAVDKPLTHVLTWIHELLPETSWLIELRMDRSADRVIILLKGLVLPGKEKSSIELIENYMQALKARLGNAALNLTTTRQRMNDTNLTLFTANFEWSESSAPAADHQGAAS